MWIALALAALLLTGCAGLGGSPQLYDPNVIVKSRPAEANEWATDIDNRRFVEPYMNALCAPDGLWAKRNTAWRLKQGEEWQKLWTFVPIPNAPPSSGAMDWSKLIEIIVGIGAKAVDIMLLTPPRTLLPPGLPPC